MTEHDSFQRACRRIVEIELLFWKSLVTRPAFPYRVLKDLGPHLVCFQDCSSVHHGMISSGPKRLLSGAPDKEIIAASTSVHRHVHFSKGAEDSCRNIFAQVVHMIKKVAVKVSKVAGRWAMKKPVRRIDQQLIVVSGRSLMSGADSETTVLLRVRRDHRWLGWGEYEV